MASALHLACPAAIERSIGICSLVPDGHSRLELSRLLTPAAVADHRTAPVNSLGYLRVMFAVDDIDETLGRLFIGLTAFSLLVAAGINLIFYFI
jgi:hypothetical protein